MNERIKELYERAHKEVVETNDYNGSAYTVREFDPEKFAELIIRDVEKVIWQSEPQKFSIIFSVKKHFGVEL